MKMADEAVSVSQQQTKPIKIAKWKVRKGNTVSVGRIILVFDFADADKPEQRKLKASQAGIIHNILAEEGKVVQPGEPLYEIKACSHPTIMNDMCAECGADLRKDDIPKSTASVPMIHAIPDLKVSEEEAQQLGQADNDRLIKDRKLVLLVDLDQTLIHTTNDNIPPNIKDVYHFQLYGPRSPWYHTRLRPGTHKFLNAICEFYELHICTFGARNYAHTIAMFLDPEQIFFSNRILSRDECFDPTSKKANLRALFPCGDDMVCIIDDREDVWSHASNLIHVKPYHFFQHTGDINAPPGLDKHEDDDKEGVDLTRFVKKTSKKSAVDEVEDSKENVEQTEKKDEQISEKSQKDINEEDAPELNSKTKDDDEQITENSKDDSNKASKLNNENMNEEQTSEKSNEDIQEEQTSKLNKENKQTDILKDLVAEDEMQKDTSDISKESNNTDVDNPKDNLKEPDIDSTDIQKEDSNSKKENNEPNTKIANENNGKLKVVPNFSVTENKTEDNLIEIEDQDDYIIYLEDILKRIHKAYYELYDKMESGKLPDLKNVIPFVKSGVLKGCKLVFSGLVPTHYKLEQSKAYQVARSLGADVQAELNVETTHLVAVRPGTAKVNAGRRKKNLKIVTPDWLWCCAERWEHADERIFPLNAKGSKNRHPPPHCSSPEHVPSYPEHDTPALRKRTPSGRFMDTINPLMSFSSDDIADMDKEVEDILDDESDDSEEEKVVSITQAAVDEDENDTEIEEVNFKHMVQTEILNAYNSQEDDGERGDETKESDSEGDQTGVKSSPKRKRVLEEEDNSQEDDLPSRKFRRGGALYELDMERSPDDNDSDSFEAPDEEDDGEWNMMGAALEREFLSD